MGSWRHRSIIIVATWLAAMGCSVGEGQGEITGSVHAASCELDESAYELVPSFFSGEVTEDQLNLRVQRGSDLETYADGLIIHVRDFKDIFENRIGIPIALSDEYTAPVQVVFYLNETCPSGFPDDHRAQPVIFSAVGGEIVFDAIYAPDIEPAATLVEARLQGASFSSATDPADGAVLDGWFSFFVQRGSPAQRFP